MIVDNENSCETEAMCAAFNERLANLWGIDTEQPDAQGGTDRVIYAPALETAAVRAASPPALNAPTTWALNGSG